MTPEQIAAGLTKAQREALLSAKVRPPSFAVRLLLGDYHEVKIGPGVLNDDLAHLAKFGLVTLPIRRGQTVIGEIHALGLEVRAILMKEQPNDQ